MFATLRNQEHGKTLKALIIHDVDPQSPGRFPHCDTLPHVVRLHRDTELYKATHSLPQVTFIGPCTLESKPVVFVGGVELRHEEVFIHSNVGIWTVDFKSFKKANEELMSRAAQPGIPSTGPVLSGPAKADIKLEWVSLTRKDRTFKHNCLSWLAALALQHCMTTSILLSVRKSGAILGDVVLGADMDVESTSWMWYPSGKPRNLKKWLHFLWDDDLSKEEESQIWGHIHPKNTGFYLMKASQGDESSVCHISFCVNPLTDIEASVVECEGKKTLVAMAEVEIASRYDQHLRLSDWGFNGNSTQSFPVFLLAKTVPIAHIGPLRSMHSDTKAMKLWKRAGQRRLPCLSIMQGLLTRLAKENEQTLASLLSVDIDYLGDDSDEDFMPVTKKQKTL